MKKKTIALIVILALALSALVSCSGNGSGTDTAGTETEKPETSAPAETDAPTDGIKLDLPDDGEFPVKATWSHYGCFDHCMYETEDEKLIEELLGALKGLEISEEQGPDITTDETVVTLVMKDGREYRYNFNGSSYEINDGKNYPYSLYVVSGGFSALNGVLSKIGENEKDLYEVDLTVADRTDEGKIALWDEEKTVVSATHFFSVGAGSIDSRTTSDPVIIDSLTDALSKVEVGDKIDKYAKGDCDIISFAMDDGSAFEISFYGGNFYYGAYEIENTVGFDNFVRYETDGYDDVKAVLDKLDVSGE